MMRTDPRKDLAQIIWIASYPKSGNTWVRAFLCAYEYGEFHINDFGLGYNMDDLNEMAHQAVSVTPIHLMSPVNNALLRPAALMFILQVGGRSRQYIKTHSALANVGGVDQIPIALTDRAIYLVRDPRDIVISLAAHMDLTHQEIVNDILNQSTALFKKTEYLAHYSGSWSDHVTSWLNPNNPIKRKVFRYEDLIHTPKIKFAEILTCLGHQSIDKTRFKKALELTTLDRFQQQEAQDGFDQSSERSTEPFFRFGKIGQWKTELAPELAEQVEHVHREMMTRFDYLQPPKNTGEVRDGDHSRHSAT